MQSVKPVVYCWITVRQGKIFIFRDIFTCKQKNNFIIDNKLSPFTKYDVSLSLGDVSAYGETVSIEFTTAEAGKKYCMKEIITTINHGSLDPQQTIIDYHHHQVPQFTVAKKMADVDFTRMHCGLNLFKKPSYRIS